jgi:hypothetical protein
VQKWIVPVRWTGALACALVLFSVQDASARAWGARQGSKPLAQRINPPAGYTRTVLPERSFGAWLRELPLLAGRPPVLLHTGRRKDNQSAHHAVFDIDVGQRNLQQCADAVIRLRAEYQWETGQRDAICFRYTNGEPIAWRRWSAGWRPRVVGRRVRWRRAQGSASYANFRAYLTNVFVYAGTASLARDMRPLLEPKRVMPGDAFVQGGFPGHAVLVVDVAANAEGQRIMLLAQSYMPAQQIHLLRNPRGGASPWYRLSQRGKLVTPEWTFEMRHLRRFRARGCGAARNNR